MERGVTDPETTDPMTGGCQCGAVRYALTPPVEETNVCHCRMCQKAGGGPFMVLARVPIDALVWTRGAPSHFDSSTFARRGFCSACGTPLTYQWTARAISVTAGSLDRPDRVRPAMQFGIEGRVPWLHGIDALPAQTTDDWITPEIRARLQNLQHPDHDT